jgi:myo-inositol 2-dehydrogenase/D-chiro-inositol 1-dehydrogenase
MHVYMVYIFKTQNEFSAACLDNTALPIDLENAVKAVRIGAALQESFINQFNFKAYL